MSDRIARRLSQADVIVSLAVVLLISAACGETVGDGEDAEPDPSDEQTVAETLTPEPTPAGVDSALSCPQQYLEVCERVLEEIGASGGASDEDVALVQEGLLQRPLEMPRLNPGDPCPVTGIVERWPTGFVGRGRGKGPVYAFIPGFIDLGVTSPARQGGVGVQTVWIADDSYRGPFVVRGRQVDGHNELRFGTDGEPTTELKLGIEGHVQTEGNPGGWRLFFGAPLVEEIGCYALQIDGPNFSEVVIFQAIFCDGSGACAFEESTLPFFAQ